MSSTQSKQYTLIKKQIFKIEVTFNDLYDLIKLNKISSDTLSKMSKIN